MLYIALCSSGSYKCNEVKYVQDLALSRKVQATTSILDMYKGRSLVSSYILRRRGIFKERHYQFEDARYWILAEITKILPLSAILTPAFPEI